MPKKINNSSITKHNHGNKTAQKIQKTNLKTLKYVT